MTAPDSTQPEQPGDEGDDVAERPDYERAAQDDLIDVEGVWAATLDSTTTTAPPPPTTVAETVQAPAPAPIATLPATGGFESALLVTAAILVGLGAGTRRLARR